MSSCPLASRAASAKKFPVLKPHLFSCPADLMAMAPMAQRSLLCPLAPSGMIPLAHGDDLAKVSTCVPLLTQTTLGAVHRTLQSRMGLRGSVTNTSPHPTAFSVFLPWTTHSNIDRHGPIFPPSSAQVSLVWACLVVLEVEPWSLSMLGKCMSYPACS